MKRFAFLTFIFAPLTFLFACVNTGFAQPARSTDHVILVTLDGLRWQELFSGADPLLIKNETYVSNPEHLKRKFFDVDSEKRRVMLLPFFWNVVASQGQLYGNHSIGCEVLVTNNEWFSYPGYSEILTGKADPEITSNDKIPNKNKTVLEIVNGLPKFKGHVAAFGSWDVFPYIVNEDRSGVPVNAGFEPAAGHELTEREVFLNELQSEIPSPWGSVRLDAFTHHFAVEYLKQHHPRLLYIAYGETDDFAHDGDYDAYLNSAHQTDKFIADLWKIVQDDPFYSGKTTLVITTDHGRGTLPIDTWRSHGTDIHGADQIWMAFLGPDTPPLGMVESCALHQNQVANTVFRLLGQDKLPAKDSGKLIKSVFSQ